MPALLSGKGAVKAPSKQPLGLRASSLSRRLNVACHAQKAEQTIGQKLAAASAAAALGFGTFSSLPAVASEFDLAASSAPAAYVNDDANVLSKSTRSDLSKKLASLEITTGYHLDVATVRKLEFETDPFAFADKVESSWYPDAKKASNTGLLLVVTSGKEGALTGGDKFLQAVGDELLDSIVSDNIPIYTELEAYNQTVLSSVERIEARLLDKPVPAAPKRNDQVRQRTFKTKEETDKSKGVTATVVGVLLLIAFVVPMLQYMGYTARD